MEVFPTPYADLNAVLRELVAGAQQILGDKFVAACLHGSFAVGDYDQDSDADFIIVVTEALSGDRVQALQNQHEWIYLLDNPWAQHIEGSYFPAGVLRQYAQRDTPLWYLDHGSRSLIESAHDNTVVVRCQLRDHGIVLAGPPPDNLIDLIPVAVLRQEILQTMHGWGRQVLAEPNQINNRFYQAFAVLNYCRMLHDLHTGFVGSKRAGAEWAKAHLDPSWAGLIDRAWSGRPDPALSSRQPAGPQDLATTLEFIQYILKASTQYAADKGGENSLAGDHDPF